MDDIIYVVECPGGFNDFSIIKQYIPPGGRISVNPSQYKQMKMSDPTVVCVEQRMELNEEGMKALALEADKKRAQKEAIAEKHAEGAPPRRKKGVGGRNLGVRDTIRPVSQAELVHLPVTKRGKDDD